MPLRHLSAHQAGDQNRCPNLESGTLAQPLVARMAKADDSLPAPVRDSISPYVQINADGTALVRSSQFELGQGAFTTVATVVAEELGLPLDKITGGWHR